MEKTVGMRIKERRLAMGMTQEEMAEKLCCNKSLISQYENCFRAGEDIDADKMIIVLKKVLTKKLS